MQPATGIVRIHAQMILMVTPHRTALMRLHGAEAHDRPRDGVRGAHGNARGGSGEERHRRSRLAQKPPKGSNLVILEPIVFTIRQPPKRVPKPMAV